MTTINWQTIESTNDGKPDSVIKTQRAKVSGGWLVRIYAAHYNTEVGNHLSMNAGYGWGYGWGFGGLTFVSDPEHNWDGS